jgi:hypothetical protein
MIKQMGTTMKKKMALNDGESNIHGCQRFSFILTLLWSIAATFGVAEERFTFFRCGGLCGMTALETARN